MMKSPIARTSNGTVKGPNGISRTADHSLPVRIKTGIEEDGDLSDFLKAGNQFVKFRIYAFQPYEMATSVMSNCWENLLERVFDFQDLFHVRGFDKVGKEFISPF